MPIRPENKNRYPENWKQIREEILSRTDNKCEFCGVENHTLRLNPKTGKEAKIVLTIAHLDHTPENNDPENLRALCQRCHNQHDAQHRAETRERNKRIKTTSILDACCGGKMFYFDKDDERVLFQDIRDADFVLCDGRKFSIHPDIQADFTDMPYPDNHFSMVVFDPPHLMRNVGASIMSGMYGSLNAKAKVPGWQHAKYGCLASDWRETIRKGFSECFRVLKPGGFLIFKWNETDIKVSAVLELTDQKPIFGHKSGKKSNTHWICFMK